MRGHNLLALLRGSGLSSLLSSPSKLRVASRLFLSDTRWCEIVTKDVSDCLDTGESDLVEERLACIHCKRGGILAASQRASFIHSRQWTDSWEDRLEYWDAFLTRWMHADSQIAKLKPNSPAALGQQKGCCRLHPRRSICSGTKQSTC